MLDHNTGNGCVLHGGILDTLSHNKELLLSTLAAVAEMESESISQNVKIIQNHLNARGEPSRKCTYGYVKEGRKWLVEPHQARFVKLGFLMAANGYGFKEIANHLNELAKSTGENRTWNSDLVKAMLYSETYIGCVLTNKNVVMRDENGVREVKNQGHEKQYYIQDHLSVNRESPSQ